MLIKKLKSNPDFWMLFSLVLVSLVAFIIFSIKEWLVLQVLAAGILIPSVSVFFLNQQLYQTMNSLLFGKKSNLKPVGSTKHRAFIRVQNSINNGKVMVSSEEDGIYIRLAGNENEGEAFSEHKVKVYGYER